MTKESQAACWLSHHPFSAAFPCYILAHHPNFLGYKFGLQGALWGKKYQFQVYGGIKKSDKDVWLQHKSAVTSSPQQTHCLPPQIFQNLRITP